MVDGGWWMEKTEGKALYCFLHPPPTIHHPACWGTVSRPCPRTDRRSPRAQGDLRSGQWRGRETPPQRGPRAFLFTIHHPPLYPQLDALAQSRRQLRLQQLAHLVRVVARAEVRADDQLVLEPICALQQVVQVHVPELVDLV